MILLVGGRIIRKLLSWKNNTIPYTATSDHLIKANTPTIELTIGSTQSFAIDTPSEMTSCLLDLFCHVSACVKTMTVRISYNQAKCPFLAKDY